MGKGTNFENDVAREVTRATADGVFAWPLKDRVAVDATDVLVLWEGGVVALECKNTGQETYSLGEAELRQLLRLSQNFVTTGVIINWSHREPMLFEPSFDDYRSLKGVDVVGNFKQGAPEEASPRINDGGQERTVALSRPSTDVWPSASSGRSAETVVIDRYGLAT